MWDVLSNLKLPLDKIVPLRYINCWDVHEAWFAVYDKVVIGISEYTFEAVPLAATVAVVA